MRVHTHSSTVSLGRLRADAIATVPDRTVASLTWRAVFQMAWKWQNYIIRWDGSGKTTLLDGMEVAKLHY